jgi:hypothetical protein
MFGYLLIGSLALAAVGILLISSVQTRIIKQHGVWHFQKRGLTNVYWRDRTTPERWYFWTGFSLVIAPFIVVGLWKVFKF